MWIHLPTSVGLPGTEASTWDSDSCSQALAASVTASGNLRPANLWQRVLRKGLLTTRLSGLTCDPFQATCIVARWILQFSAHRASPTAWPESNSEKMTNGTSGPTSSEWWEKYDHQQSFLRTCPSSSDTSGQLEIDYKKWATKLRSRCSLQRKRLERRIYGSGSSLWPTARREDGESCGNHPGATDSLRGAIEQWMTPHGMAGRDASGKLGLGGEFAKQATNWPTPDANLLNDGEDPASWIARRDRIKTEGINGNGMGIPLAMAGTMWDSPTAHDGRRPGADLDSTNGTNLNRQCALWSTPNVPNGGRSVDAETVANRGNTENGKRQVGLESEVRHWQSPQGRDSRSGIIRPQTAEKHLGSRPLNEQVLGNWNTPSATDSKGMNDGPKSLMRRQHGEMNTSDQRLRNQVTDFPLSLQAPETSQPGGESLTSAPTSLQHYPVSTSGILLYDSLVYQNSSRCAKAKGWYGERPRPFARKRLNPLFVNSLMNWPCYWTLQEPIAYGAQATASYLSAQRWEYERLCKERDLSDGL